MKRLLAILLTISLLSGMWVLPVSAGETSTNNETTRMNVCGDNLTYTVEGDVLTISGTGPMYDYSKANDAPWSGSPIHFCVIEDGVTSIGDYAFEISSAQWYRLTVPASVERIGKHAFGNGNGPVQFFGGAPEIAEDAFYGWSGWVHYVGGWKEEDMQNYGGSLTWKKGTLEKKPTNKTLYNLNETIKPEDFKFEAVLLERGAYIPQSLQIEEYDNSNCGEKSVRINADGFEFTHTYYVTDGQDYLEHMNIDVPDFMYCTGKEINYEPTISIGNIVLEKGVHYSLDYKNNLDAGKDAKIIITGIGAWEGITRTVGFHILKKDITQKDTYVRWQTFAGMPLTPETTIYQGTGPLSKEGNYTFLYENNVNVGTGICYIVGLGNFYGFQKGTFDIKAEEQSSYRWLTGAYNGKVTGELNDQVYYQELIITPGVFSVRPESKVNNTYVPHVAYYELYRVVDSQPVLVMSHETDYGYYATTEFTYDFSSVYEGAKDVGGEIYFLAYSWVDKYQNVFSGLSVLIVPAEVPDATSMVMEQLEDDGDYRRDYLSVYGPDGNVGLSTWSSSDTSVATVDGGVVTFKKPGVVTISAQYNALSASQTLEASAKPLTDCCIISADMQEQMVYLSYDDILMTEGTDYTKSITVDGDVTTVTISGIGLFTGELVRLFNTQTGEAIGETHNFDNSCDGQCNHCEYIRSNDHQAESGWIRNKTHHWHLCGVCAEKVEITEHTVNEQDSNLCDVCGTICLTGDADGDGEVTDWDGVMLARYLAGWNVEVELAALDVDGDGEVTDWDGVIMDRYLAGWNVTIG